MKRPADATSEGRAAAHSAPHHTGQFLHDVQRGLAQLQKSISPKYFYDARGSALFEAICATPEYYLTRTEMHIMDAHIGEMAQALGEDFALVELGSGASLKTRLLIEHARPAVYMPVDVSAEALRQACADLAWRFPHLRIEQQVGDFTHIALPTATMRRAIYFPGSTIGNFAPEEALRFLARLRAQAQAGELLLIGVDLKKDEAVLNAAYNDAQGVTAAFNLNLLERINRELEGDFDAAAFRHLAFYNRAAGWIEMHVQSLRAQTVRVGGMRFAFRAEETLHTEISCKYTVEEFQGMARAAGFAPRRVWTDADRFFSVHLMAAA